MTKYKELMLKLESAFIGDVIVYLEAELESVKDSYRNPRSGEIEDREGKEWVEELEELIHGLLFGTAGGMAFNEKRTKAEQNRIDELWEEWRKDNPQYFR
jgi:hypothetical protein